MPLAADRVLLTQEEFLVAAGMGKAEGPAAPSKQLAPEEAAAGVEEAAPAAGNNVVARKARKRLPQPRTPCLPIWRCQLMWHRLLMWQWQLASLSRLSLAPQR